MVYANIYKINEEEAFFHHMTSVLPSELTASQVSVSCETKKIIYFF